MMGAPNAKQSADMVNNPPHYTSHPSGVECIQIVRHMNFNLGNAIKYIWRAGLKGNIVENLRKAIFYIQNEIDRIEENQRDINRQIEEGRAVNRVDKFFSRNADNPND